VRKKVTFYAVDKTTLASVSKDIVLGLKERAKTDKKWRLRERILALLEDDPVLVAAIAMTATSYVVSNFERIPTKKLEGIAENDNILEETVRELIDKPFYVA